MTVIEISDSKVEKMSEYVEDMLWAGGELMHCLEKIKEESDMGMRGGYRGGQGGGSSQGGSRYGMRSRYDNYGSREDYGSRMGYKDDEDWEEEMGERRRRSRRTGRYM